MFQEVRAKVNLNVQQEKNRQKRYVIIAVTIKQEIVCINKRKPNHWGIKQYVRHISLYPL